MDKKILFTDLDGTLLRDGTKDISKITFDKIVEMILAGHSFVLASGRPIKSITDVLDLLGIKDKVLESDAPNKGGIYATAYNGALIYDCIEEKPIEEYRVPMDIAQKIFDMAIEEGIHIHTYISDTIITMADDKEIAFYTKNVKLKYVVETNLKDNYETSPFKLIAINLDDRAKLEAFRKKIEESEMGNSVTCAFSNQYYLEFYSNKAGKGKALTNLCNHLNIPIENSVAAGDEENDISMIEAAGTGAVMANGNQVVKNIANFITKNDNNHDGIVEIIDNCVY